MSLRHFFPCVPYMEKERPLSSSFPTYEDVPLGIPKFLIGARAFAVCWHCSVVLAGWNLAWPCRGRAALSCGWTLAAKNEISVQEQGRVRAFYCNECCDCNRKE